jgi:hypothetical protein
VQKAENGSDEGSERCSQKVDGLTEKLAEEIQERMRGAHSRFQRFSVHDRAGAPPYPLFSGGDDGMPSGHNEVSPRANGSSDINGSVGFVEGCFWIVRWRDDRSEGNAQ